MAETRTVTAIHQLDWKQKNHVGRLFLEHALLVSDIMVAVELACRKHPK